MKLIVVKTKHNNEELAQIIAKQRPQYVEFLKSLYNTFFYTEYVNDLNRVEMIALISQDALESLEIAYRKLDINYHVEDLTQDVLDFNCVDFDFPQMDEEELQEQRVFFFQARTRLLELNLDLDLILDKISKLGMDSLTEVDKQFLANY